MIIIKNLTKKYSENCGNFNINLNVNDGEVFGIIGPNGAGKTTLIRQIMGFIKSDEGIIEINNKNIWENYYILMEDIGYVPGEFDFFRNIKGIELLKLIAYVRKKKVEWKFVEKMIEYFELDCNKKIKKLSKGTKQKIAIISAIMHKPKILILDEPTSGLDPIMQNKFRKLIEEFKTNGSTIIICSHIFEEISKLCDKVAFIKQGNLVEEFKVESKNIKEIENKFEKLFFEKIGGNF